MPIVEVQVKLIGESVHMIFYEFNYAGMMIEIQVVTKPKLYSASLLQLNNEFNSLIEYVNR